MSGFKSGKFIVKDDAVGCVIFDFLIKENQWDIAFLNHFDLFAIRGIWNQYDSINHTIDKILCFTQFHFVIVMAFAYDNTVS